MAKNNYKKTLLLSLSSFSFSPLFSILPVFANNFNTKIQSENITLSANILDNQYSFKKPTFITQNNSSEVYIKSIEVKGNSIFNNEINTIIEPYKNQNITNETLANISAQITQLYLNQGYITTRAIVENIVDDVAIIQVNEGQIEAIEIKARQD